MCWPRSAAAVVGVDANPEAHEHARLRYRRPNLRFERDLVESFAEPGRRGRVPADDRAPPGPGRGARRTSSLAASGAGGHRVRLHAQRAHARAQRGRALGQPLARARVPRRGVRAAVPRGTSARSRCFGLFHARKLRVHALALRLGWDRVHPRLGLTERFYDWFTPGDLRLGLRPAPARAGRPGSRARLPRGLPRVSLERPARPARIGRRRGAGDRAAHAHALCGGLRHLAVRRGVAVGGDGRLLPAAARPARRRRAADALADAGAVRPAGSARASRERFERVRRGGAARTPTAGHRAGCATGATRRLARELERSWGDYEQRAERLRPPRRDLLGGARARTRSGPPPPPTPSCRCWPPTRACGRRCRPASTLIARALARTWRGGFWLPECAYAPWLDPALARRRRAGHLRRAHRSLWAGRAASTCARSCDESGVELVPIDRETISLVWSDDGYPADGAYRDYHHHTSTTTIRGVTTARPTTTSTRRARPEHAPTS